MGGVHQRLLAVAAIAIPLLQPLQAETIGNASLIGRFPITQEIDMEIFVLAQEAEPKIRLVLLRVMSEEVAGADTELRVTADQKPVLSSDGRRWMEIRDTGSVYAVGFLVTVDQLEKIFAAKTLEFRLGRVKHEISPEVCTMLDEGLELIPALRDFGTGEKDGKPTGELL